MFHSYFFSSKSKKKNYCWNFDEHFFSYISDDSKKNSAFFEGKITFFFARLLPNKRNCLPFMRDSFTGGAGRPVQAGPPGTGSGAPQGPGARQGNPAAMCPVGADQGPLQ